MRIYTLKKQKLKKKFLGGGGGGEGVRDSTKRPKIIIHYILPVCNMRCLNLC